MTRIKAAPSRTLRPFRAETDQPGEWRQDDRTAPTLLLLKY